MQINSLVKVCAAELNIDLCRITDKGELKKQQKLLKKRNKKGYWPQPFANQNIEELTKPAMHFPNLQSIIVTAISYNNGGESQFLSNYVTVKDYHNYLKGKLEKLAKRIQQRLDREFNYKIFVDQAPFLEKALAQKAGIGFIGKNTMLINPVLGSNLFLGEIFTDLKIKKDEPLNMDCGDCRLCLDNCKVNALKEEYLLVAEECTAYLTQKKGILSEKEIKNIGSHIWGCDDCKNICPYNKNIAESKSKKMQSFNKDLKYFLSLKRKNLPAELKETAITWRGSRILIRNAIIAASNLKKEDYFDLIEEKLTDNSPIIRYYAAYALAEINYQRSKEIIKKQIKCEKNENYKIKLEKIIEAKEGQNEY